MNPLYVIEKCYILWYMILSLHQNMRIFLKRTFYVLILCVLDDNLSVANIDIMCT